MQSYKQSPYLKLGSHSVVFIWILNDASSHAMAACGLFSTRFNLLFDNPIMLCLCCG